MGSRKLVFITGASRGIGKALAQRFLKEDYEVIGTSTGKESFKHPNLAFLKLDLSSPKSIDKCISHFLRLDKKIDILINNAGIWSGNDGDTTMYLNSLRKVLEVNLFGTIN